MTDRYFDIRLAQNETYVHLMKSTFNALAKTGVERLNIFGSERHLLYESQGEGGFILEFYGHDGKEVKRQNGKFNVSATLTYIGATGSLIHRVNKSLRNRDLQKESILEAE